MHATFQELLDVRDGAPSEPAVSQHLQVCERCRAEFARLERLKRGLDALPAFEPPANSWQRIQGALVVPATRPRNRSWPALLTAASLVVLLMSAFLLTTRPAPQSADGMPVSRTADIQALVEHSQQLEAVLRSLPPRPSVEQAATSAIIDALQARIEVLDLELSRAGTPDPAQADVARLWNDRVQLLSSLVSVRYAESAGHPRGGNQPLGLGVI